MTDPTKKRPAVAAGVIAFIATAIGTLVYVKNESGPRPPASLADTSPKGAVKANGAAPESAAGIQLCRKHVVIDRTIDVHDKVLLLVTPDSEIVVAKLIESFDNLPPEDVHPSCAGCQWRFATVVAIDTNRYTLSSYGRIWDAWPLREPLIDHDGYDAVGTLYRDAMYGTAIDPHAPKLEFDIDLPCDQTTPVRWVFGTSNTRQVTIQ